MEMRLVTMSWNLSDRRGASGGGGLVLEHSTGCFRNGSRLAGRGRGSVVLVREELMTSVMSYAWLYVPELAAQRVDMAKDV